MPFRILITRDGVDFGCGSEKHAPLLHVSGSNERNIARAELLCPRPVLTVVTVFHKKNIIPLQVHHLILLPPKRQVTLLA
jgi:hypothetical protein